MTIKYPFRQIKRDTRQASTVCMMLLGIDGIKWADMDYAMGISMMELTKQMKSPTREKALACLINWFRFCDHLIMQLVDNKSRAGLLKELDKLKEPYKELLEVKTN